MTPPLSLFYGFIGSRIVHPTQSRLSYYHPSCHMMDYIVHTMNMTLCDSFHFKRANPDYHPYILRLYCGILFWIQCLRAGNDVYALTNAQQNFLNRFLDNHPLETLTVPGPLLGLFKTLCSSQPEFPYYGKVYPHIPSKPGPSRRDVPGIFALLEDLNRLFSQDPPIYPKKGKHIPVTENAVSIFGHKTFRVHADRTEPEKWSLVSPGLQYPCEADQKLNESFAERYDDFVFPVTAATDNLEKISSFFQLLHSLKDPAPLVTALHMAWLLTKSWFVSLNRNHQHALRISVQAMSLATRALSLPQLTETAAAFSQTHIRMFPNHPFLARFGSKTLAHGPFWNRRPIGSSLTDSSYLTIPSIVKQAFKFKGSAS